jgi:hypothetical protein
MSLAITRKVAGLMVGAVVLGGPVRADEWDLGNDSDIGSGTDNALFHGSEQIHDLAFVSGLNADEDWYLLTVRPFSSYQFMVDSFTGDLDLVSPGLQRLNIGQVVQESSVVLEAGGVLSLSWFRGAGTTDETNFVRVKGPACGTACATSDTYRARFYETTYTVPRFNNSGSQATVLLIQNATDRTCSANMFFMDNTGAMVGNSAFSLAPHALLVFPTTIVVANQSGSVRIAQTCGYGGLSGKAVSVEPATGFTFDTAVQHRPH